MMSSLDDFLVVLQKLTRFSPMFCFYIPWKRQKTQDFLTFSGVIDTEQLGKTGYIVCDCIPFISVGKYHFQV